MDKSKLKKTGSIAVNALLYAFLLICILSVFLTVSSKKEADGAVEVLGYQMRIVTSESMAKSEYTDVSTYRIKDIPLRSMVFVKVMPDDPAEADEFYRSLKVGDVLTFRYVYATQVTITHRIIAITEKDTGGFVIELAGDNKSAEGGDLTQIIDTSIPNNTNYVIGKVTFQAKLFGAAMSFLMQPIGIVLLIILPCFVIIMLEVLKIANVLTAEKKAKEQKDLKDFVEQLKKRELEKSEKAIKAADDAEKHPNEYRKYLEDLKKDGKPLPAGEMIKKDSEAISAP